MRKCDENILSTIKLADEMIALAQEGDEWAEDDGCGVLYGILRDAGYKIKTMAEQEKISHIQSGRWDRADDLVTGTENK
jgi:hypothetical protein